MASTEQARRALPHNCLHLKVIKSVPTNDNHSTYSFAVSIVSWEDTSRAKFLLKHLSFFQVSRIPKGFLEEVSLELETAVNVSLLLLTDCILVL